ncbi:MAG: hypothetical protein A3F75_05380 [Betaproteobacteria bacterium RIFCSPLOWO2_12_FULL_64_23]|nr:MAG: hypothetical protein A3F75_05380 [Betaproteobacteria bacterium RIFCSPLOWO2_12_FULL_64_23]
MILTVVRMQYQPLGFINSMVDPLSTLTIGSINTSEGEDVGSVSAGMLPIPTVTDISRVLNCGFFPKGCSPQAFRQAAIELSTSLAATTVGTHSARQDAKSMTIGVICFDDFMLKYLPALLKVLSHRSRLWKSPHPSIASVLQLICLKLVGSSRQATALH